MTHRIRISQEAYDLLESEKRPDESFSDVLRRLIGRYEKREFAKREKSIFKNEEFKSFDKE